MHNYLYRYEVRENKFSCCGKRTYNFSIYDRLEKRNIANGFHNEWEAKLWYNNSNLSILDLDSHVNYVGNYF